MTLRTRKSIIWTALILGLAGAIVAWLWHGNPSNRDIALTSGKTPLLVKQEAETFPTLGLVKSVGWQSKEAPAAAKGLAVSRLAEGLDHPRTLLTLPNGDVLVTETAAPATPESKDGGLGAYFMRKFMPKDGGEGASPNRILLLRDADGDGQAEQRFTLATKGLDSPSGMAWAAGKLYVANHNALLSYDYTPGATAIAAEPKKLMDLPAGGYHWMRNLVLNPDGKTLYIAVGSASNIGEYGMDAEAHRASILEYTFATGNSRPYAVGMRDPNGMAWNPSTGELWVTVRERDMLGPDLVPDYLSNVPIGVHYGWPWVYWRDNFDDRVNASMPEFLTEYTRKPEFAMGAHTGVMGLQFSTGGNLMGEPFANGAFIARHGSWNRKPLCGFDVVFVKFDKNGNPLGLPLPVLTGFQTGKDYTVYGRPVWLAWDKPGALLVSDDAGGIIWRVVSPGAKPSLAPKPVQVGHMPPQRELKGDPRSQFQADFKSDGVRISQ